MEEREEGLAEERDKERVGVGSREQEEKEEERGKKKECSRKSIHIRSFISEALHTYTREF